MPPPGLLAIPTSGGTTSTEALIKAAHLVLDNCGIQMGASKVSKLVRTYEHQVAPKGFPFFAYLTNAVQMSAEQQQRALLNSDIARAIAYADPTGETAVNNVMRGNHHG
jgi:hypothetical protein